MDLLPANMVYHINMRMLKMSLQLSRLGRAEYTAERFSRNPGLFGLLTCVEAHLQKWIPIGVPPTDFNLRATLTSGQAFRWIFVDEREEWHGVVNGRVWRLRQPTFSEPVFFHCSCTEVLPADRVCVPTSEENSPAPGELLDYFRLNIRLADLVRGWRARDRWFPSGPSSGALGIRLLRQDPVETLFAFITSANNNVPRITRLLNSLCQGYGTRLEVPRLAHEKPSFHYTFPDLQTLASAGMVESLRTLGFGYRSKFIQSAARYLLANGGVARLHKLRTLPLQERRQFLINIPGIGNKVADCICLSSLDAINVVPVDVHMLEAARDRGLTKLPPKKMKPSDYASVSNALSHLWADWAGWAQAIDFATRIRGNSVKSSAETYVGSKRKLQ